MEFKISLTVSELAILYGIIEGCESGTKNRNNLLYMAAIRGMKDKLEKLMDEYLKENQPDENSGNRADPDNHSCNTDGDTD